MTFFLNFLNGDKNVSFDMELFKKSALNYYEKIHFGYKEAQVREKQFQALQSEEEVQKLKENLAVWLAKKQMFINSGEHEFELKKQALQKKLAENAKESNNYSDILVDYFAELGEKEYDFKQASTDLDWQIERAKNKLEGYGKNYYSSLERTKELAKKTRIEIVGLFGPEIEEKLKNIETKEINTEELIEQFKKEEEEKNNQ